MNFFAAMDPRLAREAGGTWLAVTSLSFDISVLELCWTLARGFTVVLHSTHRRQGDATAKLDFSLFYFASDNCTTPQDGTTAAGGREIRRQARLRAPSGRPSATSTPSAASTPIRR